MEINQEPLEYFYVNDRVLRKDSILAEGGFGFVYKVRDASGGEEYALKKVNITNSETLRVIKNEIKIWKECSSTGHDNIVKFVDASHDKENNCIYIVSELCGGGTLFDLLEKYDGKMSEK